jgi:hypothetical protein
MDLGPIGGRFAPPLAETTAPPVQSTVPKSHRDRVLDLVGRTEITTTMFAEDSAAERFLALAEVFVVDPENPCAVSQFLPAYRAWQAAEECIDPAERQRYVNLHGADGQTPLARALLRDKDHLIQCSWPGAPMP